MIEEFSISISAAAITTIFAAADGEALEEAVEDAFPGPRVSNSGGEYGEVEMPQVGLLRPLAAKDLSDETLRYLLLVSALVPGSASTKSR